jgi:RNA polymerase sigma factor (sigma-70 family)
VRRVLANDSEAVDAFVLRMRCIPRFVEATNTRRGGPLDAETVRDVVQDVLERVWRKLAAYRGRAKLETWVYRFCDLQVRSTIRRAGPRRTVPLDDTLADTKDAACAGADGADGARIALATLQSLEPFDARILRLKHFELMTFAAMSVHLARSPNTIKTRYYRALHRLRHRLRASRRPSHDQEAGGAQCA